MQGSNAVLNVITIPPGATKTSARLVLDGVRGAIFVYTSGGPLGALIGSWAGTAGTDPYGNVYPAGIDVSMGSITGTTFLGTDFILNSSGLFFYSAAPALGNMLISLAPVAGTDSFGNTYLQGFTVYQTLSGDRYAMQVGINNWAGFLSWSVSDMTNPPFGPASLNAQASSSAAQAQLTSGAETSSDVAATFTVQSQVMGGHNNGIATLIAGVSQFGPTTATAMFWNANVQAMSLPETSNVISAVSGAAEMYCGSTGALTTVRPTGVTQVLDTAIFSGGTPMYSVGNTTTPGNISDLITIPANDLQAGSRWEIEIHGYGQAGATGTEAHTVAILLNGSSTVSATVGTVLFNAVSQLFSFTIRAIVQGLSTGSGGLCLIHLTGVVGNTTTNRGGSTQATYESAGPSGTGINTTVSNTIRLQLTWGGAGGTGQVFNTLLQGVYRRGL